MKRIIAMLLAVMMLFTSGGEILAAQMPANNETQTRATGNEMPTGLMKPEVVAIPEEKLPKDSYDCEYIMSSSKFSAVYNHDWDKYSTNYYYNLLSEEEKELFDALDELCLYYLENDADIVDAKLDSVTIPFYMTINELFDFWMIFMHSNPQYYFLLNSYVYGYSGDQATRIILRCYEAFADGADRADATDAVLAQIEEWEAIVDAYSSDEDKLQVIYELVCDKVTYNWDSYYGYATEEQSFSQTAYSVFCTDATVCAGYADAMTIMCNAVGIDAVAVTSYNHQWNKVRINDCWYNYDATWGDGDSSGNNYWYYARSDAWYAADNYSHVEEDYLDDYSPNAIIDIQPTDYYTPGEYPEIENITETPTINVGYTSDGYTISFSCDTSNATIYYTLDGTDPSPAFTKSNKYTGETILLPDSYVVKAIAVYDGYLDSYVQEASVIENEYSISYVLDGGVNSPNNPSKIAEFDKVELQPATKDGYEFEGWFYDSTFESPVKTIVGATTNITLYAKWNRIVEDLSGATVSLSKSKFDYNEEEHKPTITVKLNGKTLKEKDDYKVTYENNKNIGKAKVTITGVNGYKGTITKEFTIAAKTGTTFVVSKNTYKITSSSTVSFLKPSSSATKVTIPKTVKIGGKTFNVTTIADKAFRNHKKLKEVSIGANVKKIGVSAFEGCKKLTKVSIGSAVTTIEDKAFKNCTALKSITIPSKVTKIDKQAFYGCKKLSKITIKSSKVKTFGKESFKKISSKATIKMPKKYLNKYKKSLKKAGVSSKASFKKL